LVIEDTGKGLSADELETVFKPFERSSDTSEHAEDAMG
jgi:signal transduction histidine kinase